MNKKTAFAMLGVIGLSLLLAGCAGLFHSPAPRDAVPIAPSETTSVATPDPREVGEAVIEGEYIPDRIVIGHTNDAAGFAAREAVMDLVGEAILDSVVLDEIVLVSINIRDDLDVPEAVGLVIRLAKGMPDGQPPAGPRERLEGLLFVEPDYDIPTPEPVPGPGVAVSSLDPMVHDPTANLRPFQYALDAVNADEAWALDLTGAGIIVAVLDTGVDGTHPDLVGQLVEGREVRGMAPLFPHLNADTHGHGTHCAGIIAALNDGRGIVGLAYNARIMDIRIFDPGWIGAINFARGVEWAVLNGAHVLSNSWGGVAYSQAIMAALNFALSQGVVVVASAGNTFYPMWFRPASVAGVIAVAASDPHNRKADFSTPGTWVDVAAPGVRVLSSVRSQIIQPGTGRPLLYDYWDGTSMSGPYVAALAAMILQRAPTATPYQVKRLITGTARDIEAPGFDTGTGYGLMQADRALTAPLPLDDGAALRVRVVTASSTPLWGVAWPVAFMDITLRKGGQIVAIGQTDAWGHLNLGYPPAFGIGDFPILEPGTYEIIVGGDDAVLFFDRTANRVTGQATVTLTAGEVETVDIAVSTTLEVTLSWTGGDAATAIDLVVAEPPGMAWTRATAPGVWGTWTADQSGATGTETYTLLPVHFDDALYALGVDFTAGAPATVTVVVRQNTVTETYTFTLTTLGLYPAFTPGPPVARWPGWWSNFAGPWVY